MASWVLACGAPSGCETVTAGPTQLPDDALKRAGWINHSGHGWLCPDNHTRQRPHLMLPDRGKWIRRA